MRGLGYIPHKTIHLHLMLGAEAQSHFLLTEDVVSAIHNRYSLRSSLSILVRFSISTYVVRVLARSSKRSCQINAVVNKQGSCCKVDSLQSTTPCTRDRSTALICPDYYSSTGDPQGKRGWSNIRQDSYKHQVGWYVDVASSSMCRT